MVRYLVTRRTSQRLFRFPPGDEVVEQIFLFALSYAASLSGVRVHGWVAPAYRWVGPVREAVQLPAVVEMKVAIPPSLEDWDRTELMEMLNEELRAIPTPTNPIGMKRIKEQSIWDRPNTQPKKRGMRNPSIAGDTERRIAMIALLRAFRASARSRSIVTRAQRTHPTLL